MTLYRLAKIVYVNKIGVYPRIKLTVPTKTSTKVTIKNCQNAWAFFISIKSKATNKNLMADKPKTTSTKYRQPYKYAEAKAVAVVKIYNKIKVVLWVSFISTIFKFIITYKLLIKKLNTA